MYLLVYTIIIALISGYIGISLYKAFHKQVLQNHVEE